MLLLVSLTMVACSKKDDDVVVPVANSSDGKPLTAGSADFSKFVSLGNSLSAGFSDNALFRDGQLGAWTNILAEQFKFVGGGEYKMALTNNNVGGLLFGGNPNARFGPRLFFTGQGLGVAQGVGFTPNEVFSPALSLAGPYNNVGVPGAKSFHLLSAGYGQAANLATFTANPYYVRFAPQGANAKSMLDYAFDQTPTFFSLWIGNNDVLGYALAGGVKSAEDPMFGDDITPVPTFTFAYNTIVNKMTTNANTKGAISNIPYVNSIPFFTTVPNAVPLTRTLVDQLNAGYAQYNGGLALAANANLITQDEKNRRTIAFISDADLTVPSKVNRLVIVDEYLSDVQLGPNALPKYRQTTSEDLLLLSSQGAPLNAVFFQAGNGTATPLADRFVLSKDEVMELKTATDAYNATIKSIANAKGLAFIDANLLLRNVASFGVSDSGITLKSAFATGGAFSMDGVHPAPRGYALIANEFIKEINKTYGSNMKTVDLAKYRFLYPSVIGDGNK